MAILASGSYYLYSTNYNLRKANEPAKQNTGEVEDGFIPPVIFTGGDQGFISLKLESVEKINHNTKRLRFALPDQNSVSGLHVASAILAKYKGPGMEKPVIRPYTPISGEGMCIISFTLMILTS